MVRLTIILLFASPCLAEDVLFDTPQVSDGKRADVDTGHADLTPPPDPPGPIPPFPSRFYPQLHRPLSHFGYFPRADDYIPVDSSDLIRAASGVVWMDFGATNDQLKRINPQLARLVYSIAIKWHINKDHQSQYLKWLDDRRIDRSNGFFVCSRT